MQTYTRIDELSACVASLASCTSPKRRTDLSGSLDCSLPYSPLLPSPLRSLTRAASEATGASVSDIGRAYGHYFITVRAGPVMYILSHTALRQQPQCLLAIKQSFISSSTPEPLLVLLPFSFDPCSVLITGHR